MGDQNTVGDGPNGPGFNSYFSSMQAARSSFFSSQAAASAAAATSANNADTTPTADGTTLALTGSTAITLSTPTSDAGSATDTAASISDQSTAASPSDQSTAASPSDQSTDNIASYLTATTSSSVPSPFAGGAGSSTPSTFATSTSPVSEAASSAATESPSSTSLAATSPASTTPAQAESQGATLPPLSQDRHHGLTPGATAAAVIVPLLFLLGLLAAFFLLRRRRNAKRKADNSPSTTFAAMPTMKQTSHTNQRSVDSTAPMLASSSPHNPTYYTGLDTMSSHRTSTRDPSNDFAQSPGGTTFYAPPPAYKKARSTHSGPAGSDAPPPSYNPPSTPPPQTARNIPQLDLPASGAAFDPFDDPESPISTFSRTGSLDEALALHSPVSPIAEHSPAPAQDSSRLQAMSPRPGTSRTTTGLSINSDAYSDTASVHSARAARMSVSFGGPQVVRTHTNGTGGEERSVQWE